MTASISFYDSFRKKMADGTMDLDGHTFKVALVSSGYTFSSSHGVLTDITNELSGNGYARQSLANLVFTQTGATVKFDADNTEFTASGGSLTARRAVIFDDTPANKDLVASVLLDTTPADVTATDGNKIILAWNASGIFTIT